MSVASNIPESVRRFFQKGETGPKDVKQWLEWFKEPTVQKGQLTLLHAGEDSYRTQIISAGLDANDQLYLTVDSLLPAPDFSESTVALHGKLVHYDGGIEVITSFVSTFNGEISHERGNIVQLDAITDLEIESREFLATLPENRQFNLGMIWFGDWVQVKISQSTISRLIFETDLETSIPPDGYAVPKATLQLEHNGPEIPVKLRIVSRSIPVYEARIEKIDSLAQSKLTAIIEEIWRKETGLTRIRKQEKQDVGYINKAHSSLDDAFKAHILYLGKDTLWRSRLEKHGIVIPFPTLDADRLADKVQELTRCDLVVGDADIWGEEAIRAERVFRSWPKTKDTPRFWFAAPREGLTDLCEFGAYDYIDRHEDETTFSQRVAWALSGNTLGRGIGVALVTDNMRLRYRLGLTLASKYRKVTVFPKRGGLLSFLKIRRPMWILLDEALFGRELKHDLEPLSEWAMENGAELLLLVRGADSEKTFDCLKAGVRDIIILDPALHKAAERIAARVYGEDS